MPWQPTHVFYPDAELLLCELLQDRLPAQGYSGADHQVVVGRKVPTVRPQRLVVVNRDGGTLRELRDQARIRLRCWAEDDTAASDLIRTVLAICLALPGFSGITHAEHLSGPLEVPDPSGTPQRYALIQIHTRPSRSLT